MSWCGPRHGGCGERSATEGQSRTRPGVTAGNRQGGARESNDAPRAPREAAAYVHPCPLRSGLLDTDSLRPNDPRPHWARSDAASTSTLPVRPRPAGGCFATRRRASPCPPASAPPVSGCGSRGALSCRSSTVLSIASPLAGTGAARYYDARGVWSDARSAVSNGSRDLLRRSAGRPERPTRSGSPRRHLGLLGGVRSFRSPRLHGTMRSNTRSFEDAMPASDGLDGRRQERMPCSRRRRSRRVLCGMSPAPSLERGRAAGGFAAAEAVRRVGSAGALPASPVHYGFDACACAAARASYSVAWSA